MAQYKAGHHMQLEAVRWKPGIESKTGVGCKFLYLVICISSFPHLLRVSPSV